MKNFQLVSEKNWVELIPIKLTKEEDNILLLSREEDIELINSILAKLKSEKKEIIEEDKLQLLNSFYNSVKPQLKENEVYELISLDLNEKSENIFTGILNCRINNEHVQIRF
jgi:hypothetical protein